MLPDFKSSHFELFGLPTGFAMDAAALDTAYRNLQAQVHPDKFAHLPDADKRLSMQWATRVNEAYQALKSPLNRAVYLLTLQGIDALDPKNTQMPAAFLMQQIEWREAIQEARGAANIEGLQTVEADLNRAAKRIQAQLADDLDVRKDGPAAALTVRQLKFIEKIRAEIDDSYALLDN